nr:immunoglobulin light chain junction region [Macaca mulatta]
CMQSIDFPLTF